MKLNCKAGDLAITVKCHVPDNLGKIVQIIAYEGLQEWANYPDGSIKKSKGGLVPDCFLRPISGLELEDEVSNTEDAPINEKTEA